MMAATSVFLHQANNPEQSKDVVTGWKITTDKQLSIQEMQVPTGSLGSMCSMPTELLHEDARLSRDGNHDGILGKCPVGICEVSAGPMCVAHDEPTSSKQLEGRTCQTEVPVPTEDAEHESTSDAVSTKGVTTERWKRTTSEDIRRTLFRSKPHHNRKRACRESWKVLSNVVKRWVPKGEAEAYRTPMSSKVTLTRTQKRRTQRRKNQQYWESHRECRQKSTPGREKIQLVTKWVPKTKLTTANTAKQFTRTQKRRAQRRKNQQSWNSYRKVQRSHAPMKSGIQWITIWVPKERLTSSDVIEQPAIKVPKGYGVITHAVHNARNQFTRTQKRRLYRQKAACIKKNANTGAQAGLVKQVWMPKTKSETISEKVSASSSHSSMIDDSSVNYDKMEHAEANTDRATDPSNEVTTDKDNESECTSVGNEELADVVQHPPFLMMTTYVAPPIAVGMQHEQVSIPQGSTTADTLILVQHDWSLGAADSANEAVLGPSHPTSTSSPSTPTSNQISSETLLPTSRVNQDESHVGTCDHHAWGQLSTPNSKWRVMVANGVGRYKLPQSEQVMVTTEFNSPTLETFKPKPKPNGEWTRHEPKKSRVSVHNRPMLKEYLLHDKVGSMRSVLDYENFLEGLIKTQKRRRRRLKDQACRKREEQCVAKVRDKKKQGRMPRQRLRIQLTTGDAELASGA